MSRVSISTNVGRVKAERRAAAARGLRLAAEHVLQVANTKVPHEQGTLQRSGQADVDDQQLRASVYYDTPYAVYQHEVLDLRHDGGREAKYLENALTGEAATVRAIIANAMGG